MKYRSMTDVLARSFRLCFVFVLIVGLAVTGCDSNGGGMREDLESKTITGQVTNNSSTGSSTASTTHSKAVRDGVEGATVTAVRVEADGTTRALEGEATTDANGKFTITVEGERIPDVVRLNAEGEGDFFSSVIVMTGDQNEAQAQPMTAETAAEARVYVDAKADDEASSHSGGVTAADVAMYVNPNAAADINAGATQSSEVAAAVASTVDAETQMNADLEGAASADAIAETKANLYADLQSGLATASSASNRAKVVTSFENGMANLYVEAGGTAESQARSRQAGTSVMIEFSGTVSSDAALGFRKQAEHLRAEATARAEEAIFEAEGASSSTIDALVQARQQLKTDLQAASSIDAMANAKSAYEATVESQMESALEVNAAAISLAETEIEGSLEALFTALGSIGGTLDGAAEAAVSAYNSFHSNAQASAKASFKATTSGSTAEAAAKALLYVSAHGDS